MEGLGTVKVLFFRIVMGGVVLFVNPYEGRGFVVPFPSKDWDHYVIGSAFSKVNWYMTNVFYCFMFSWFGMPA